MTDWPTVSPHTPFNVLFALMLLKILLTDTYTDNQPPNNLLDVQIQDGIMH